MGTNFGTKLTTTWPPVKDNCALFAPTPPYTQLLSYTAWQWDRYLVPQNVFLVLR